MKETTPRRIAIIGLPGSGKSTVAIALGKALGIPVHHLDKYMFSGRQRRDQTEFLAEKETLIRGNSWIIEGCSISTLEMRFATADTIIYLNLPRFTCLWRVLKRMFTSSAHLSETGCLDGVNWPLIKYIWTFKREKWGQIKELQSKYPNVNFYNIRTSKDIEKLLKTFKKPDESPRVSREE